MNKEQKLGIGIAVIGAIIIIGVGMIVKKTNSTQAIKHSDSSVPSQNKKQGASNSSTKENEPTSPITQLLIHPNKKASYSSMQKALQRLPEELSFADVSALREVLDRPIENFPKRLRPIEVNSIKNDILDKLLRQKKLPTGMGYQLVKMVEDSKNDSIWRDYSIQYMPQYYERALQDSSVSEQERTAVRNALFSALNQREDTLAGTALIALELLSKNDPDFDRKTILKTATEITNDETASTSSRLTALRISAKKGDAKSVVKTARTLAQTGETVLLRSAAIVTLGEIGSFDDQELLESYLQSNNKQIVSAAKIALNTLQKR